MIQFKPTLTKALLIARFKSLFAPEMVCRIPNLVDPLPFFRKKSI